MSEEEDNEVPQPRPEPVVFDAEDTIKILLATDCHLGYERSTKRAQENDSLITFEEILQLAAEHEVDFILLGGDLFHDTKPPQDVVSKCIELLRKYCMGTRDVKIQMLTDPDIIFKYCDNKIVNFEDPNLNVSIPVFSIHGNHDDPSSGAKGVLDLLSSTGLVNYFGKWVDFKKIEIPPMILKKGNTYISLYGLSYINDKRLARLIRDGNFGMLRATEIPESFNMFVLHQNRSCHGHLNNLSYIKEEKLPKFLRFIMWGHEHECKIRPEHYEDPDYWISQPGSSVATSLSEGESLPKHVGLLSVHKTDFKLKALKLKTVRPFVLGNVSVARDMPDLKNKRKELWPELILEYVKDYIEHEMIPQATELYTGHPNQPKLPLLRVKVHITSDDERFETTKISQEYCEVVANPMDIILFVRESRKPTHLGGGREDIEGKFFEFDDIYDEGGWNRTVQDGIRKYFAEEENADKLTVLSVTGLNEALTRFTDGDDNYAFEELVEHQKKKIIQHLMKQDIDVNDDNQFKEKIKDFQKDRMRMNGEEEEMLQLRQEAAAKRKETSRQEVFHEGVDDEEGVVVRSVGRGGRGKGRTKQSVVLNSDGEDDEEEEMPRPIAKGRGRGRGRARGQSATATKRGRGRAAKQLDISITSPLPTSSTNQSSRSRFFQTAADQSRAKDDEFVDDSD